MEKHEYQTLFEFETGYWWYQALHAILLDQMRDLGLGPEGRILDAGCGTAQNMVNVSEAISPHTFGFDLSPHAPPFWKRRSVDGRVLRASINEIPFQDEVFALSISIDVLESDAVDDYLAYQELWRVTQNGGYVMLIVPAYKWLLTEEHHKAVAASRRYVKKDVKALVESWPVDIIRLTHLFASVFPPVAIFRLLLRLKPTGNEGETAHSELRPLPRWINTILKVIMGIERQLLRWFDMPFGSSILVIVRKRSNDG